MAKDRSLGKTTTYVGFVDMCGPIWVKYEVNQS